MLERRDAMEFFRDGCADQFRIHIRKPWTPRSGSKVNRKALTSAVVSSRDFVNARQRAEKQVLIPAGTLIAFSSGPSFNDHHFIWDLLDRVHAKHPQMRSEEHTSELQSLMRISYAVFCLKQKTEH